MRILAYIIKILLTVLVLSFFAKSFFVYKDVLLSMNSKKELQGKIVYSARGWYIKTIELPEGKTRTIYEISSEINRNYGLVHSPYFSPDGSMIVYNQSNQPSDEKIYIMDADGKNQALFLNLGNGTAALCPSWSSDGKSIAYVVEKGWRQGLYTIRIADRFITHISNIEPAKSQPTWSPDCKKIAFDSSQKQKKYLGNYRYAVKNMGGSYIIEIESKKIERYFDLISEPAWSPDGKMFAYGDKFGFHIINLEDISKDDFSFISHPKIFFGIGGALPIRWSPDGKYVVFAQEIWPKIAGIYVVSIANPKKKIRIGTDKLAIIGMSWVR